MQPHRLLVDTHHRFACRERLFVNGQYSPQARDIFLIEFGQAPHFFPATVSGRGFRAGLGPSLVPPVAPACASLLPPLASAPSTAPGPPAVDRKPGPRCAAAAVHPTALLSPAAPPRTRPAPTRLADSVGWSATRSLGSTQRCGPPCESLAHPPVVAAPRRVAPFYRLQTATQQFIQLLLFRLRQPNLNPPAIFHVPAIRPDTLGHKYLHVLLSMWSRY